MKFFTTLILSLVFTVVVFGQQQSPNISLIIADDLGIDSMPGFQIESDNMPVTPTLNELPENGLAF